MAIMQEYIPPPLYASGYYHTEQFMPSPSEFRIFNSYVNDVLFRRDMKDVIVKMASLEGRIFGRKFYVWLSLIIEI